MIKPAEYLPAHEPPDEPHPFALITGRTIYQFHTRTKTGRAPQLDDAAPRMWVEISAADARPHGIADGDRVRVSSPRGAVHAQARVSAIREGVLFLPFHYSYWDLAEPARTAHDRAANELTPTEWDPASKQPLFKTGAVHLTRLSAPPDRGAGPEPAGRAAPQTLSTHLAAAPGHSPEATVQQRQEEARR